MVSQYVGPTALPSSALPETANPMVRLCKSSWWVDGGWVDQSAPSDLAAMTPCPRPGVSGWTSGLCINRQRPCISNQFQCLGDSSADQQVGMLAPASTPKSTLGHLGLCKGLCQMPDRSAS